MMKMSLRRWSMIWAGLVVFALMGIAACDREEYEPTAVGADEGSSVAAMQDQRSEHYSLRFENTEIQAGQEAQVEIHVLPGADLEINLEFPWAIEFDEVEGLDLGVGRIDWDGSAGELHGQGQGDGEFRGDLLLEKEMATIMMAVEAAEPGEYQVSGRADFSVCNEEICPILRDRPVNFVVQVR